MPTTPVSAVRAMVGIRRSTGVVIAAMTNARRAIQSQVLHSRGRGFLPSLGHEIVERPLSGRSSLGVSFGCFAIPRW
jgi:hypothetical protein